MVSLEDFKNVQMQVDKLKERLDYMAPMLSLLNFTQDYFQRVESEASVQLLRLKNSRTGALAPTADSVEDKMAPHVIETAKWLHAMTDIAMALHGGATLSKSPGLESRTPPSQRTVNASSQLSTSASNSPYPASDTRPASSSKRFDSDAVASDSSRRSRCDAQPELPRHDVAHVRTGAKRESGVSNLDTTLEFSGLALGKGTWANAYRRASGTRREALKLLCTSGIVTERELADDLTVISDEHIEECISIANKMLQKWPPEQGALPQREAKAFFEEQLAALYMKRAPAPFG